MLTNRKKISIEWGDCDPAGIAYFPRYFEYCDACTSALFARAGLPKPQMLKNYGIAGIPIVDAHGRFLAPSQFGETVEVESRIVEWGRSSFSVHHRIFRGKALAAEISEIRVWVKRAKDGSGRLQGQAIPEEVKRRFARSSRRRK
jgi:4-hydroxybenzoyl-CoA thioesterase